MGETSTPATPATIPAPKEPADQKGGTLSRPVLPYVIAALVASTAMAWYFFVFVPAKHDYFVGLRFRTLAVASRQVSTKIENLGRALGSVAFGGTDGKTSSSTTNDCRSSDPTYAKNRKNYIRLVLPQIQIDGPRRPVVAGPALAGCAVTGRVAWADVVSAAAASSRRDFDDLLLATGNGDVVWQRESSTPRIANLSELLGAKDEAGGWGFSWREQSTSPVKKDPKYLNGTAQLKRVNVGGESSLLLVQGVPVSGAGITLPGQVNDGSGPTLYVAGLVVTDTLQQQARRIPAAWLVPFACAILFLFLAIPFVKMATLTSRERFRFTDVLLMMVATISAAGFGALMPFVSAPATSADATLEKFENTIERNLAAETTKILALGTYIDKHRDKIKLHECDALASGIAADREYECKFWEARQASTTELAAVDVDLAKPPIELDVVIWMDAQGAQVRKWTTKRQVTGPAPHQGFEHFRALTNDTLWTVDGRPERFTVEPLRAPTTSELGVVFAMKAQKENESSAKYFALNVRPQSLVDALVPPGHGFAIVAPTGMVLFHSEEGLSLEENFFEEIGDGREVRASVEARRLLQWSGDYHGRRHRFRMQPMSVFAGCPWSIVTFEETEPRLAAEVAQQSGTLRLGIVNLLYLGLLTLLFSFYSTLKGRRSRDLMQMMLADRRVQGVRVRILIVLAAIEVVAFVLAITRRSRPDVLYVLFAAAPVTALLVTFLVRRWDGKETKEETPTERTMTKRRGWWKDLVAACEHLLLVIVVGALPAAGFTQITAAVQHANDADRWLEVAQSRWEARQSRLAERLHSPNYADRGLVEQGFGASSFDRRAPYSYLLTLTGVGEGPPLPAQSKDGPIEVAERGDGFVRSILEWSPFSTTDRPLSSAKTRASDGPRAGLTVAPVSNGMSVWLVALGLLILAASLAAVLWARSKLLTHDAGVPSLASTIASIKNTRGAVVMLVGPPMTGKDQALALAIKAEQRAAEEERRKKLTPEQHRGLVPMSEFKPFGTVDTVRLLDKTLTPERIEELVARVNGAITTAMLAGAPTQFWVHVSNLETQLADLTSRSRVLDLLQRLGEGPDDQVRILAVTSSVDPIAHFEEIFIEERDRIYADPVPEVGLSRWALLLSRVGRCYMPISAKEGREQRCQEAWDRWWSYKPTKWRETLAAELGGLAPLEPIRKELETMWSAYTEVPFEEIVRTIRLRTSAYYQLLWSTCTRSEKLVLIQLAQEGFVVEQSWGVVAPLIARGIIVERPVAALFNRTFRDFLLDIEQDEVVQQWERGDGHGLWLVSGRLIGSSVVAGLIFFLLTQDVSVQSILPVVSGTGVFSVPLVRTLIAHFSTKGGSASA